jgi:hypothetical protein
MALADHGHFLALEFIAVVAFPAGIFGSADLVVFNGVGNEWRLRREVVHDQWCLARALANVSLSHQCGVVLSEAELFAI